MNPSRKIESASIPYSKESCQPIEKTFCALVAFVQKKTGLHQAKRIVCTALQLSSLELLKKWNDPLTPQEEEILLSCFKRYLHHEPLSRIVGFRGFWNSIFLLNDATLDPRPESELLIERALGFFIKKRPPRRILDLGTGTGCLLLSLLQEFPQATGLGVDCAAQALQAAQKNAQRLNLTERAQWRVGYWTQGLEQQTFDIIVANPPYIPCEKYHTLPLAVRDFDPRRALDGGPQGLACYQELIPPIPEILDPDGVFILEIGAGQGASVRRILEPYFQKTALFFDLCGQERVLLSWAPNSTQKI